MFITICSREPQVLSCGLCRSRSMKSLGNWNLRICERKKAHRKEGKSASALRPNKEMRCCWMFVTVEVSTDDNTVKVWWNILYLFARISWMPNFPCRISWNWQTPVSSKTYTLCVKANRITGPAAVAIAVVHFLFITVCIAIEQWCNNSVDVRWIIGAGRRSLFFEFRQFSHDSRIQFRRCQCFTGCMAAGQMDRRMRQLRITSNHKQTATELGAEAKSNLRKIFFFFSRSLCDVWWCVLRAHGV